MSYSARWDIHLNKKVKIIFKTMVTKTANIIWEDRAAEAMNTHKTPAINSRNFYECWEKPNVFL